MNTSTEGPSSTDPAAPGKPQTAPGPRGRALSASRAEFDHDPIAALLRLHQEWGDVVRWRIARVRGHALAHPDDLQRVLHDAADRYRLDRHDAALRRLFAGTALARDEAALELAGATGATGAPADSGGALAAAARLDAVMQPAGDIALALVERWYRQGAGGAPVDIVPDLLQTSLGMLGHIVFEADLVGRTEALGPTLRAALDTLHARRSAGSKPPGWAASTFNWRLRQARSGIASIAADLMEQQRDGADGETQADLAAQAEAWEVLVAGHDAIGNAAAWAVHLLTQHPEVLRRLRDELDPVLGGRAPAADDAPRLPYLEQVVEECLRVFPPTWALTRIAAADDDIGGYRIAAGSAVFISPYVTHRHPEFWSNPEAFDPENFAAARREPRHPYAYLPFGMSPGRSALHRIAVLQMRILVAVVAQHFELSALPGHRVTAVARSTLRPLSGIRLTLKARPTALGEAPAPAQRALDARGPREALWPESFLELPDDDDDVDDSPAASADGSDDAGPAEPAPGAAGDAAPGAVSWLAAAGMAGMAGMADRADTPGAARRAGTDRTIGIDAATGSRAPALPAHRHVWRIGPAGVLPAEPARRLAGRRIAIVNGSSGTAERLAGTLARACAHAHVFTPEGPDLAAAARAFRERSGVLDGVIDLSLDSACDGPDDDSSQAWQRPLKTSLALLQAVRDDWLGIDDPERVFYVAVTWLDGAMGLGGAATVPAHGGHPLHQPLGGLWAGLAKSLPQELPICNVRVIDLDIREVAYAGERIVAELYRWGAFEVAWRGGQRSTLVAHAVAPTLPLPLPQPGDVVLMTGCAHPRGLQLASAVAERCGAMVVVADRLALPDGDEPWAALDPAAFRRWAAKTLRSAAPWRPAAELRSEMLALQRRRGLAATLADVEARGLAVHYRSCDLGDEEALGHLIDEFGESIRHVVHGDEPVPAQRLLQAGPEDFVAAVEASVNGYAALQRAIADLPLRQVLSLGSLAGRFGGGTGEAADAVAREAITRLGLRGAPLRRGSVKTLAWQGDGIGGDDGSGNGSGKGSSSVISSGSIGDGAGDDARSGLLADDVIAQCFAELADGSSGEVSYLDRQYPAPGPASLRGFAPLPGVPGFAERATQRVYLGQARRFVPTTRLETMLTIDRDSAPFLDELRLDAQPAIGVGMLLEIAAACGAWVLPDAGAGAALASIEQIAVDTGALTLPAAGTPLRYHVDAHRRDADAPWCVELRIDCAEPQPPAQSKSQSRSPQQPQTQPPARPPQPLQRQPLLHARLHYRHGAAAAPHEAVRLEASATASAFANPWTSATSTARPGGRLQWTGAVLRPAAWQLRSDGLWQGATDEADPADLWSLLHPPRLALPLNGLEQSLRRLASGALDVSQLRIARLDLGDAAPSRTLAMLLAADGARVEILNADGDMVAQLHGVVWGATAPIDAPATDLAVEEA